MQRVLVIGNCGSGKSTASRQLARRLDLPLIHLDREFWRPGWVEPSGAEWDRRTQELVEGERWLIDGNYSNSLERRLERADTVVWLDFPRLFCLGQVLRRVRVQYGRTREDCGVDCPERFDLSFLKWVWDYPRRSRGRTLELQGKYTGLDWHVFRTRRELYQWIEGIGEQ
jgi:adenylate kinase family enzyme